MFHRSSLLVAFLVPFLTPAAPAQLEWVRKDFPAGSGHQMVYDAARERLVLFGGSISGPALDDTWEWDGTSWTLREPAFRPPARGGHAMAYDSARRRVVLFGGQSRSGLLADTWEWDGTTWTEMDSLTTPVPRQGHAMAYDPLRARVVLFGGCIGFPDRDIGDTWEWDGAAWTLLAPRTSPAKRCGQEMVYDEARKTVLLFGGTTALPGSSKAQTDTWEWDGTTWTERFPMERPNLVGSLAYDSARQRVVLFRPGFQSLIDPVTWEWDGASWTRLFPPLSPSWGGTMAYDAARGRTVYVSASDDVPPETWEWDGAAWKVVAPASGPPRHGFHAMTYDEDHEQVVLYAGRGHVSGETGTWTWDGVRWTEHRPAVSPGPRLGHAMTYDVERQRAVLFGGSPGLWDTWEWDGNTWTEHITADYPRTVSYHGMAYDPGSQRTVLFGGQDPLTGEYLAETWEWDGADWTERSPGTSPSARGGARMAYDEARQRVVLFGGFWGSGTLADTWEWNGTDWIQRNPATSPSPRALYAMAYDPDRERVVLFGGVTPLLPGSEETWEWDGTNWARVMTTTSPPARVDTAMAYDAARHRMVLFGGSGSAVTDVLATWILGETESASTQTYGIGCPGSHGTPRLDGFGKPQLGNSSFAFDLSSARPAAPVLLAVSTGSASQLFGPCTLLVDPNSVVPLPAMSNGAGFASVRVAVPAFPNLIGLELYAQGVVLDPTTVLSLAGSNGLMVRVGN